MTSRRRAAGVSFAVGCCSAPPSVQCLDLVSLDGERVDDTFVLEHRGARWLVFFLERGEKRDFRKHGSEDAACRDLLARLER